jgi:hypothetical protein
MIPSKMPFTADNVVPGAAGYSLMHPEERLFILNSIPRIGLVCEIGTFQGATCSMWAKERPGVRFLCIEDFSEVGDESRICLDLWMQNRCKNMDLFLGSSEEFGRLCRPCAFDVVVVDGNHDYESCLRDLELSFRIVKRSGGIAAHDYCPEQGMFDGVVRAVDEFCASHGLHVNRRVISAAVIEVPQ